MLEPLDPDTLGGAVYAALVAQPAASVGELAASTGHPPEQILPALDELCRLRLAAEREPDPAAAEHVRRFEAQPPDGYAAELLSGYERRLDAARDAHRHLSDMFWLARRGAAHYPGLEVVQERSLVREQIHRMLAETEHEVRALDRGPYLSTTQEQYDAETAAQARRLADGISYRVVYEQAALATHPNALACIRNGEQARTAPSLPLKLFLMDSKRAILPLDPAGLTDGATLIVYPSALLSALENTFEIFWDLATPVSHPAPSVGEHLSGQHRAVLELLAAGATDDQIATRLRLSRSTVTRTCATLFQRLGANTRFQAGINAQRQDWLS